MQPPHADMECWKSSSGISGGVEAGEAILASISSANAHNQVLVEPCSAEVVFMN